MARNGQGFAGGTVHIDVVTAPFTEKLGAMVFQVTDQSIRFMK
jgi:hypothetical protein